MDLDLVANGSPSWLARLGDGADVWTGPANAFDHGLPATHSVSVIPADAIRSPAGTGIAVPAHESGAGPFTVEHHDLGGWTGVWHPVGGNWILRRTGGEQWAVTRSPSWPQTWVHVRFLLRNLVTGHLLSQPGAQVVHTVAASRTGRHDAGVVLVVGPTRSGKSRLANRLVADGVVDTVVEDDCGVIREGALEGLFPTEHELRRRRRHDVTAVVMLDDGSSGVAVVDRDRAGAWCAACQVPWPVGWLPGAVARPRRPVDVGSALCLVAPARCNTDDQAVNELRRFLDGSPA